MAAAGGPGNGGRAAGADRLTDEKEIEDRFYKDLEFGTAGLRGIMGAGSNRMNSRTVGRATQGLADYLKNKYPGETERGVVIAYDSRNHSREFALEMSSARQGSRSAFFWNWNRSRCCPLRCGNFTLSAGL